MNFRPWSKLCFCRFLFFGRGRNAFFFIFQLSAAAETLFLLFFTRRPWPKADFHRFLIFPSLGKHFSVNACCFCNRFLRRFFLGVILKWCIFASRLIDGIS